VPPYGGGSGGGVGGGGGGGGARFDEQSAYGEKNKAKFVGELCRPGS